MPNFEFWLSNEDTDRLFAIKKAQDKEDMTGNEFAAHLLKKELHRLHPALVEFDETGNEIIKEK